MRALKNGSKFESLKSYMEKTEKYRDLIEPCSVTVPKPGVLSEEIKASPEEQPFSMKNNVTSPNFT